MKHAFRLAVLVTAVSLSTFSTAQAGTCSVRCSNGTTWNGSTATKFECCSKIETFCGGSGRATYNGAQCPL